MCHYGVSLEGSISAFQVVDKLRAAGFSAARWKELGQQLTPQADLEAIRVDYQNSHDRFEAVVNGWLRNGDNVRWEALATAVAHCKGGGRNIAQRLLTAVGIGI